MNDNMNTPEGRAILLDIFGRLGSIQEKLNSIEKLEHKIESIELQLREHEQFKNKISAYIWIAGSIASGVAYFMIGGIKYALEKWFH